MSLAAVITTFNEEDIVAATVGHLFDQGIDEVYAADASTDDTWEVLLNAGATVCKDTHPYHHQPYWINRLAAIANEAGHDWILPFDADEFWSAGELTIGELVGVCGPEFDVMYAPMIQYRDWDHAYLERPPFPKVLYRYSPAMCVTNGNHEVHGPGRRAVSTLTVHELQYRGLEHFRRKIADRNRTIDPSLPVTDGAHHRQYEHATVEEIDAAWEQLTSRPVTKSPIPTKRRP